MALVGQFSKKLFRLSSLKHVRVLQKAYIGSFFGDSTKRGMPSPYPKTQEERIAAAKKYNIRIEDYETYPDDGLGWGDYPKIPEVHQDSRNPHADWDFPEERRNYGEVLHIQEDFLRRFTPNRTKQYKYSMMQMAAAFFGVVGFFGFAFWVGNIYTNFLPVLPKQYPENNKLIPRYLDRHSHGVTHYKF